MVLISVGVVISGMLSLSLIKTNYEESVKESLIENAKLVKHFVETNGPIGSMEVWLSDFDSDTEIRVTFIDAFGVVLLDSSADASSLENHGRRPEVLRAYAGEIGVDKRFSTSVKSELYYVAIPVNHDVVKVIRLSIPLNDLTRYLDKMVVNIIIAAVIGVFLATLLGLRFIKMFTKPLGDLTHATMKISKGDYGQQVHVQSNDEIGQLANSFNKMSLELNDRIHQLRESNSTNQAILTSMLNGVIAVDESMKIMFINKAAQRMFHLVEKDYIGLDIKKAFENHILGSLFSKDFNIYDQLDREIETKDPLRVYKVHSNIIRDQSDEAIPLGLLMSIIDITQMRQLENMRKDFVANVSHELKTPLTSIQGFIETLKEGAAEDKVIRDKFIDIIEIEAGRLKDLIDDILVLSDIEKSTIAHTVTSVDLKEVVHEVSGMLSQIARKKNISLNFELDDNLKPIKANKVWIKQMLVNLMDNGIKYTPENGKVNLIIHQKTKGIKIIVEDNGIGIEEQHLDRLFERFYRVDKGRSKKEGGTGLGLAIVKHIVLALKGEIRVISEVDRGTAFYIELPE